MEEYIALGHMTLCAEDEDGYYLPHHAVLKESSETTKVRVVFDASAKTSTGISLNDVLMVGPTIQNSIFEQILSFRTHAFVMTADIEKMYRQILVHPEDRKCQRVLWYSGRKIATFQLSTVTFGTAAAPFLAIRTIQQLARDEARDFPRASKLLLRDFYVDDLTSGADSPEELLEIRDEMIELLGRGGFVIRKWASNHAAVLDNIDKKFVDLDCMVKENPVQKTLGVVWNSQQDILSYTVRPSDPQNANTKRKLLSEISTIFDPLGLLGPVIMYAKTPIQDCWKAKITWDESLPQDIHTRWGSLAEQLVLLSGVAIPRQLLIAKPVRIEIHGFCDASLRGYGACLYLRSIDSLGNIMIRLVCSKSRVAPLTGVTIPRLELCSSSVLKKLFVEAKAQFRFDVARVTLWSDSMIVLCWLKKSPHVLRTFESNRVHDIQSLGNQVAWKHVRSEDNPADALSRGQLPSNFVSNPSWNSGPSWLSLPESEWPESIEPKVTNLPGLKKDPETRVSKIVKLVPPLTCSELIDAERCVLLMIQRERYPSELRHLSKSTSEIPKAALKGTSFASLHPLIDETGLIRVGGRLKKSELPYDQKHPILLPNKHAVTDMIIRRAHQSHHHAGIQATLYCLHNKFWILNGKDQVRHIIHQCIDCIRQKPKLGHARMADLPAVRVQGAPAFCNVGVDFFGPISIKEKRDRNRTFLKTYGCVFVCMASKAVHIELATDLSTEGFLAAFRRFTSRRGVPEHVYSDNGTNFVGANRELREIYDLFNTPEFEQAIGNYALAKRIEWHFNPPLSPHFGGIWEAAVKSFKHHLKRVIKDQKLTYEQMNTLLIEIEALLNSRPLYTVSADPNDPLAMSPAHLLCGRPFTCLPEKNLISVSDNRLSTYNFTIKARQDFWSKWSKEYLHELQIRQKWHDSTSELAVGTVVLIMDDKTTSGRWPLGVVIEVFPGSDEVARVALVKTADGIYKRNITHMCILPVISQDSSLKTCT